MNKNIPFQVEQLIQAMLNPKDSVYLRGNYRARLDLIADEINKAIVKYDREIFMADALRGKKRV